MTSPQRHSMFPGAGDGFDPQAAGVAVGALGVSVGVIRGSFAEPLVGVAVSTCCTTSSSPPDEVIRMAPTAPVTPKSATPATAQSGFTASPFLVAASLY